MKLWLLILTGAVLLSAGCGRSRGEIENVLTARARAQAKLVHTARVKLELVAVAGGDSDALLISPSRYAEALQKIDASRCPPDFKTAWKNYVAAWLMDDGNSNKKYSVKVLPETTDGPPPGNSIAEQNHAARHTALLA